MKNYKITAAFLFLLLPVSGIYSQTHVSVPLSDTVYEFLESAHIRGLTGSLPAVKPYTKSLVIRLLQEINNGKSRLSPGEQKVLNNFLDRFEPQKENKGGLSQGWLKWHNAIFPGRAGLPIKLKLSQDVSDSNSSYLQFEIEPYLEGDIGRNISYYALFRAGLYILPGRIHTINPPIEEPYNFSKRWDTALHPASSNIGAYLSWATDSEPNNFGIAINGDIQASFWGNRLNLSFGRTRREWGYGEGSLYLNALARPFTALEITFRPWKWIDISTIYGMLEYYVYPGQEQPTEWSQTVSEDQQNNYSLFQVDLRPFEWMTISFFDAAVFPKRMDLAYMVPLFSKTLIQHYSGDFDNLVMGGTLVLDWPGFMRFYAGLFIDEWNLVGENFFNKDRNMYAFQTGVKLPLPIRNFSWSRLVFQYTKIEPYTYTHPPTKVPGYPNLYDGIRHPSVTSKEYDELKEKSDWDDFNMETGYMNNGEPMGYHLEPNSDEFLLIFSGWPKNWLRTHFKYRLIRHGVAGKVDGSSYMDYIPYYTYKSPKKTEPRWQDDSLYKKDFLKDGLYEWYHVFAFSSDIDFTILQNWPLKLNLKYALVYQYRTNYMSNGDYGPVDDDFDNFRHIFSLNFHLFPY